MISHDTSVERKYSDSFFMFGYFTIIFGNASNFVGLIENLCNAQTMSQIVRDLSYTVNTIEVSLKIAFPFKRMRKSIQCNFLINFFIIIGIFILKYANFLTKREISLHVSWTILEVVKLVNLFHLIFYVEFMRFALSCLNEKVMKLMSDTNIFWHHETNKEWLCVIRHTKTIYLRVFCISQRANTLFGWFLVAFTIGVTADVIYYTYQLFVHAYGQANIFRNY